jgi:branched-chain amino acid transport system substrate-binding protein
MPTRKTAVLATAAVTAALLSGLAPGPAQADQVIKIGLIATLSGPTASLGEAIDNGAELYAKLHQPELPKGVTVQIIRRDDTGPQPEVAKRLARELIVDDHVQFLGGIVYTPNAAAIAPLATQSKTPLVLMNASTSNLTQLSPYIVRTSYTQWQTSYTLGQWAAEHGYKRVYTAVSDYSAGTDAEKAFQAGFTSKGGQIVGSLHMPVTTPDYVPYMQRVKDAKPQALFMFTNSGAVTTSAVKAFASAGLRAAGIGLLGPGDIVDDAQLSVMGDAALGTTTAAIYTTQLKNPHNAQFLADWHKQYGPNSTPNFMAVCGYDGMAAIFDAIKQLKGNVTGDAAMKVLANFKSSESPRGSIAIDPATRDIVENVYIDKVEKVGGKLGNVEIDTVHGVKDPWKLVKR